MARAEKGPAQAVHGPAEVAKQLAALQKMTVNELADKFLQLYGQPTRSRNKPYLQKRLAWRVQELAEGGLSQGALAKIAELGDEFPEKWRRRLAAKAPVPERDSRLPTAGTALTRVYQGRQHRVTVRGDGFVYGGKEFKSLSAIARLITGTSWNGFIFFGLAPRASGAKK